MAKGGGKGQMAPTQVGVGSAKLPAGANVYGGAGPPPSPPVPEVAPVSNRIAGLASGAIPTDRINSGGRAGKLTFGQQMRQDQQMGGGGGGGTWIPPQTTQKVTPGGGNQNAFSPQAATVEDVTTPGRWAFANLMARLSNPTVSRGGGYDTRGPTGWGGFSPSGRAGMGGLSRGGLY